MTWAAIAVGAGTAVAGTAGALLSNKGGDDGSDLQEEMYNLQRHDWQQRLKRYLQMIKPARQEYRRALAGEWDVGTRAQMQQRLEGITDQSTQNRYQLVSALAGRGAGAGGGLVAGLRGIGEQATLARSEAWRDLETQRRSTALGGIQNIAAETSNIGPSYPGMYSPQQEQQQPAVDLSGLGLALGYGLNQAKTTPRTNPSSYGGATSNYYAPLWEILNRTR